MDLIFWRHAEAHEWTEGCDDLDRALTHRGEKQAMRMSRWLDRQLPEGTRILCSPARRCEQTVAALDRKYRVKEELSPDGTVECLLQVVQWPEAKLPVLIVGHQPLFGQAIAKLLNLNDEEMSIRKGAVWWLKSREREGQLQTVVVTVQAPETL